MVVTGGRTRRRHGDGWRRQAAAATMLDCSRDFLFTCVSGGLGACVCVCVCV